MVSSANPSGTTRRRTQFNSIVIVLIVCLVSASVLSAVFYHDYESVLASEPHYAYPKYYVQALNTSLLSGPLENGSIIGIPVNLSWPAHVYGPLSYDGPIYFFILWTTHNYPSRFSNVISDDRNWSIYFVGPVNNTTISLSLPPGSYLFCVAFLSSSPVKGVAHINVDYSYFSP
jgi:hypothetical protein